MASEVLKGKKKEDRQNKLDEWRVAGA